MYMIYAYAIYTNTYIYREHIHIYKYIYIEKPTASAADLWYPRLGCLDDWMLVFLFARR